MTPQQIYDQYLQLHSHYINTYIVLDSYLGKKYGVLPLERKIRPVDFTKFLQGWNTLVTYFIKCFSHNSTLVGLTKPLSSSISQLQAVDFWRVAVDNNDFIKKRSALDNAVKTVRDFLTNPIIINLVLTDEFYAALLCIVKFSNLLQPNLTIRVEESYRYHFPFLCTVGEAIFKKMLEEESEPLKEQCAVMLQTLYDWREAKDPITLVEVIQTLNQELPRYQKICETYALQKQRDVRLGALAITAFHDFMEMPKQQPEKEEAINNGSELKLTK